MTSRQVFQNRFPPFGHPEQPDICAPDASLGSWLLCPAAALLQGHSGARGLGRPELSQSYMHMASKLFTFTFARTSTPAYPWRSPRCSYKPVKGRSHTVQERISMHPHKPHATSQPSRFSHTHSLTAQLAQPPATPHGARHVVISPVPSFLCCAIPEPSIVTSDGACCVSHGTTLVVPLRADAPTVSSLLTNTPISLSW